MAKTDYNRNKPVLHQFGPQWYDSWTFADYELRSTFASSKSPWKRGKLNLQENRIERIFKEEKGTIPVTAVAGTDGVFSILGSIYIHPHWTHDLYLATFELGLKAANTAAGRFHSKMEQRVILGMEYIAERKSLLDMLVSGLNFLKDIIVAVKKRKWKTLRKYDPRRKKITLKRVEMSFHEKWLQYHFAIAPMMQDIYNTVTGVRPMPQELVRVRGYEFFTNFRSHHDSWQDSWCLQIASARVTYTGKVHIEDPATYVANQIGLDPGKFIYDVIPLSFVLEWFFNVGQWIDALSTPGVNASDVSMTTLTSLKSTYDGIYFRKATSPGIKYKSFGSGLALKDVKYTRVTNVGIPPIKIVWSGGVDSLWRVVTSIALIRSILSK